MAASVIQDNDSLHLTLNDHLLPGLCQKDICLLDTVHQDSPIGIRQLFRAMVGLTQSCGKLLGAHSIQPRFPVPRIGATGRASVPSTARACKLPLRGNAAMRTLESLLPRGRIQLVFRYAPSSARLSSQSVRLMDFPPDGRGSSTSRWPRDAATRLWHPESQAWTSVVRGTQGRRSPDEGGVV